MIVSVCLGNVPVFLGTDALGVLVAVLVECPVAADLAGSDGIAVDVDASEYVLA